jgi:hypothetical protein
MIRMNGKNIFYQFPSWILLKKNSAKFHNLSIATLNTKHFSIIEEVKLLDMTTE